MRKVSVLIGVIGLFATGWFVLQSVSIDYVATVDDELSKLEMELAALDAAELSAAAAADAKNKIATRLGTINDSLAASQDTVLSETQLLMLDGGLRRLQQILSEHQGTLSVLDVSTNQPNVESEGETLAALSETIIAIKDSLNIPVSTLPDSPMNARYKIEGSEVQLDAGVAVTEITATSSTQIITRYFGNEVQVDLNNDGREDLVFLLTQSTGGSGSFFYVVAALNTEAGWVGSQGFFLGDRIAPQTTEMSQKPSHQNVVVVNYMDREAGQPMTDEPSLGKSIWLAFDPLSMQFGGVDQDFAGEADPNLMTLTMKPWTWVSTQYSDGTQIIPSERQAFTLTFTADSRVTIQTDCNTLQAEYQVNKNNITFGTMLSTKMFCEASQEQVFVTMLNKIQSYFFTNKGELVFDLRFDSGSSVFQ